MDSTYKVLARIDAPAGMPAEKIQREVMSYLFDHPSVRVRLLKVDTWVDEQPDNLANGSEAYLATATIDTRSDLPWEDLHRILGELIGDIEQPLAAQVLRIDERPDEIDQIISAYQSHADDMVDTHFDGTGPREPEQTVSFWWYKLPADQSEVPVTSGGTFLAKLQGAVHVPTPGEKVRLFGTPLRVTDRHTAYSAFIDEDGTRRTEVRVDVYVDVLRA
jgi:hypothetical protein